ncbi:L-asparaginase [Plectosphaerella plurivora]|uniref:L-asparaginase n=1 Tax=Plectosphaerella plurivora TaxID=936078 RepID=A0A9P8VAJ9_9PEZI|nr:L-asparaginase [Plectosphaerella plurivora]
MDYRRQTSIKPRIIVHGGAGNLTPSTLPQELYQEYRRALLSILSRTNEFMNTPNKEQAVLGRLPSALQTATFAVCLLEDEPLFNSGRGAVFTRDGINELEASVMVSRGYKKRAVGVSGIRSVKNPILLASKMLEAGEKDLEASSAASGPVADIPSAQGHGHLHGQELTETLAQKYGLDIVDPSYFFTQRRWDEHVRSLEREKTEGGASASWSKTEYLPQGTCGAVSLDAEGVVCVATSTGGLTNKLTGRIGDTPTVGAGFWAGEWERPAEHQQWLPALFREPGPIVQLSAGLSELLGRCMSAPPRYLPLGSGEASLRRVSFAASGTGNGDSFLRIAAVRSVAARAEWKPEPSSKSITAITGPGGELQRSAGDRWGRTGEGQGGMIGIELVRDYDARGDIVRIRSEILQDFNCGGMFRAWIDDDGEPHAQVWRDDDGTLDKQR